LAVAAVVVMTVEHYQPLVVQVVEVHTTTLVPLALQAKVMQVEQEQAEAIQVVAVVLVVLDRIMLLVETVLVVQVLHHPLMVLLLRELVAVVDIQRVVEVQVAAVHTKTPLHPIQVVAVVAVVVLVLVVRVSLFFVTWVHKKEQVVL
jgi:hypothetical protein